MNTTLFYICIMFAILIIFILVYYFYLYTTSNIQKYKIKLLADETTINNDYEEAFPIKTFITTRDTLYVPKLGYGLSFCWEMYIPNNNSNANWNHSYNNIKPIIYMDDSPQIGYHPKKNYLSIIIKYRNNPFYAQYNEIKITNIKQQKWSKYILIINGRTIQLYIDGKINTIQYLPSLPVIYDIKSDITIGKKNNNFLGKIRNLILIPYPITASDIQEL